MECQLLNLSDNKFFDNDTSEPPSEMFFLKDTSKKYVFSNDAHTFMCGAEDAADIIGRTTCDFFAQNLASRYAEMDEEVLGGHDYLDRFDFLLDMNGNPIWTLFDRTKVYCEKGETLIRGKSKQLPRFRNSYKVYERLYKATELISEKFKNNISVKEIAGINKCSVSQIERDFSKILNMTPSAYQARLKLKSITSQLKAGVPLVQIALEAGFSEQSTLSRFFKKHTHLTMQEYKTRYLSN